MTQTGSGQPDAETVGLAHSLLPPRDAIAIQRAYTDRWPGDGQAEADADHAAHLDRFIDDPRYDNGFWEE